MDDFEFSAGLSNTKISGMKLEGSFRRFGESVGGLVESVTFGTEETGFIEISGFEPFQSRNILNKARSCAYGMSEDTLFAGNDVIIGTQEYEDKLYGSDNLNGYGGNDYIDGNGGYDNIIGGTGRDTFVVRDYQTDRGYKNGGSPHFLDFNTGDDFILLDNIDPKTLSLSLSNNSTILRGGDIIDGYISVRQALAYLPASIESLNEINFV